jgi:hypothetical protein
LARYKKLKKGKKKDDSSSSSSSSSSGSDDAVRMRVKFVHFNPDKSHMTFHTWTSVVNVHSGLEGHFKDAIDKNLPITEGDGVSRSRARRNKVKRGKAWSYLQNTLVEGTAFHILTTSQTTSGKDPYVASKLLCNRFDPKENADVLEMKRKLHSTELSPDDADPSVWLLANEELNHKIQACEDNGGKTDMEMIELQFLRLPMEHYKSF